MDLTELKRDFYKRFGASESFLSFSRVGLLCPLLGLDAARCPSLSCSLSMRVQLYGRRLKGDIVKLESARNNLCIIFRFGGRIPSQHSALFEMLEKMHAYGAGGAELFFDSSVPEFLGSERELKAAAFRVMSDIYNIHPPVSVCGGSAEHYSALLNSRRGYCRAIPDTASVPLPLTGLKLLIIQTQKADKTPRERYIEKAYERLKRIYPHIRSFADVSPARLEYARGAIRDKTALNYVRHIVDEAERIKYAAEELKKCNIRALTDAMNLSEQSAEKLWSPEREHVLLAREAVRTDGVLCARIWKNGIISVAEEDKLDDAVSAVTRSFESAVGCRPFVCIADTFGDGVSECEKQ